MLAIDAIGRGNSGVPGRLLDHPDFDPTWGGRTSLDYLKSLPYVDTQRIGLMGHSLGGEMVLRLIGDVPRIYGLLNILFQKLPSLLFDYLPASRSRFACRRGGDVQFFDISTALISSYLVPQ